MYNDVRVWYFVNVMTITNNTNMPVMTDSYRILCLLWRVYGMVMSVLWWKDEVKFCPECVFRLKAHLKWTHRVLISTWGCLQVMTYLHFTATTRRTQTPTPPKVRQWPQAWAQVQASLHTQLAHTTRFRSRSLSLSRLLAQSPSSNKPQHLHSRWG